MNNLTISPTETGAATSKWIIDISLNDKIIYSRVPLNLPITHAEEREIVWYLERYPQSPFDADRAIQCIRLLQRYSDALFDQLKLATISPRIKLAETQGCDAETLMVDIFESCATTSSIHQIYWELLEDERLWLGMVGDIVVRRRFASCRISKQLKDFGNLPNHDKLAPWRPIVTSTRPSTFNFLLVVARNLDADNPEVEPAVGLASLAALFQEIEQSSGSRIVLEVVRPGTYAAFRKHLQLSTEKHGRGYFHLVHFDMHGVVMKRPIRGTTEEAMPGAVAGLLFASKTQDRKLDFVPARRIAKVVQEHGIRLIVSNGCRSASTDVHDVEANLAAVMLEEGITNVLAMQTEFMSGAAELFIMQFYRGFLQHGVSFSRAVRDARKYLQRNQTRSARFGLTVPLQDWIVPVAYLTNADLKIVYPKVHQHKPPLPCERVVGPDIKFDGPGLVGRDRDALRIERDLIESQVLILYGQAGVGKTALLRQMVNVWRATNFAEKVFYVDYAQSPAPVTTQRLVDRINGNECPEPGLVQKMGEAILGWWNKEKPTPPRDVPAEVAQLVQSCHDHSTIFILDSLDAALSSLPPSYRLESLVEETRQELYQFVNSLINFTPAKGQKKPLLLLIGRGNEAWWNARFQQIPARFTNLKPLDLPSAVILGTKILQRTGVDTSNWNVAETNSLHQIVNLFGRLPLVLEIMLPNAQNVSLGEFYQNMHLHTIPAADAVWKRKPSTPGSDRILRDLRRIDLLSYPVRNLLRSLTFFWLEGPALIGILDAWHELDPQMLKMFENNFGTILRLFSDLGAWAVNTDTRCITEVHPLMTMFLRSTLQSYQTFEPRLMDNQLLKAFRVMVDRTQKELLTLQFSGKYDFALICKIQKRSLVNIVAVMQDCASNGGSLIVEDWPRESLFYFFSTSRFAFRDSIPDHQHLLSYLKPTLQQYVATFGGPQKALSTQNLPFALQILNHLSIMYLHELQFNSLEEATHHINFSIELIKASEYEHPPMSTPTDIYWKQIAFRLKALLCLFQRNFDDAQAYWDKQTELEIITLGEARNIDGQQGSRNALAESWLRGMANLEQMDSPERTRVVNVLEEVSTTYLPALAQMRQAAWAHVVKAVKENGDSMLEGEVRPAAQVFMEQVFGLSTPALTRLLDISKETSYDIGYLLEEHDYTSIDHLMQELETGLDHADAGRIVRTEYKLFREALEQRNWMGARVHIGLLRRHLLSVPGMPPEMLAGLSILEELGGEAEGEDLSELFNAVRTSIAHGEAAVLANPATS